MDLEISRYSTCRVSAFVSYSTSSLISELRELAIKIRCLGFGYALGILTI